VRKKYRFSTFAILAIFAVVALDRATLDLLDIEHHLSTSGSEASEKITQKRKDEKSLPKQQSWVIPTYPAGDLMVIKTKKAHPAKRKKKQKSKKENRTKNSPNHNPLKKVSNKRDGDFPILVVGYEDIGFSGYLDAVERVGHFFLIAKTERGTEIGSEISLKNGTVYRHKIDLDNLAVKRPHLVSDEMIEERLSGISLPEDVQTDSIILVFSKPFDDLLWDTIESALSKSKLSINDVVRIEGGYVKEREDVFLLIRSAENRETGEDILLNRRLRISLG
jgi:hypothetical protein